MSLQHFFLKNQVLDSCIKQSCNAGFLLELESEDLHHAKVLRLKAGEHIGVIDASGVFYECEIMDCQDSLIVKNCCKKNNHTSNTEIWLCPGLAKANKLDDVVRACTEIGVYGFLPTNFKRSVVKLDANKAKQKTARLKKISKSAAMQSGRTVIPKVYQPIDIDSLCEKLTNFDAVFVCWEESENTNDIYSVCKNLKEKNKAKVAIVIGPEGGISESEINRFISKIKNTYVVSIGESILRTETANIAACSIINFLLKC